MSCTTTCRKPHGNQSHCGACHRTFSTVAAFDHHRIGPVDDRLCADPLARDMHLNGHGVWSRAGGVRFWEARPQDADEPQTAERGSGVVPVGVGESEAATATWGDHPLQETYPGSGIYE